MLRFAEKCLKENQKENLIHTPESDKCIRRGKIIIMQLSGAPGFFLRTRQ
jgi:hypothetical protein